MLLQRVFFYHLLYYQSEKAMAPHSSTLAWKIPWMEEPGRRQSMGSQRVGNDWATSLSLFTFMHWRRKWQPTPVFLPGESQGRGALWAAVYGVAQSRTRLKWLSSILSVSSVQSLSHARLFATPCNEACQASLSITNFQSLLEIISITSHQIDAIQVSNPLSSPSPPAFSLAQHQGLFHWVSSSHWVAKVLEFQLQHQLFQWISGLISFWMDWLYLLSVQGTLKSLLQYHSSDASIFQCSAFFIVQLSHPYMTTGKTIALTR